MRTVALSSPIDSIVRSPKMTSIWRRPQRLTLLDQRAADWRDELSNSDGCFVDKDEDDDDGYCFDVVVVDGDVDDDDDVKMCR